MSSLVSEKAQKRKNSDGHDTDGHKVNKLCGPDYQIKPLKRCHAILPNEVEGDVEMPEVARDNIEKLNGNDTASIESKNVISRVDPRTLKVDSAIMSDIGEFGLGAEKVVGDIIEELQNKCAKITLKKRPNMLSVSAQSSPIKPTGYRDILPISGASSPTPKVARTLMPASRPASPRGLF